VISQTEQIRQNPYRYFQEIKINNHEGIISALRKENPNSISVEASSSWDSSNFQSAIFFNIMIQLLEQQIVPIVRFVFLSLIIKF
jgi:hypothetical protein